MSRVSVQGAEERLGYNAVETGPGPDTLSGYFALMGCTDTANLADRGCGGVDGPKITYNHVYLEAWSEGYTSQWDLIQRQYPAMAPVNSGSMGYDGSAGSFFPKVILDEALRREGAMLDYYRGWDTTWSQPWNYFDSLSAINLSQMYRCNETRAWLTDPNLDYLRVTGGH